jgi:glycine/D-amino acid oxidase-like deaminating enzyme
MAARLKEAPLAQRGRADAEVTRRLASAAPRSFWLDDPAAPPPLPSLSASLRCDLAVLGGGFAGLWTAYLAKQADPSLDVVVLEARRVAWAASGRNGGFCEASLTHGEANGRARFPAEYDRLEALGRANLDDIERVVTAERIACDWERTGSLTVAVAPWQLRALRGEGAAPEGWLDADEVRAEVNSPTYLGGVWERGTAAMLNPARLAWGLRDACLRAGVRMFEDSPAGGVARDGRAVLVAVGERRVHAERVALATNAFTSLVPAARRRIVPVYDHVLVTEPLDSAQLRSVGWAHRQGVSDAGNRFHYYRLTADNRILWGGWDATYHFGGKVDARYDQQPATFVKLARHFAETFPSLADLRFTHRWGGPIDTCGRFCPFFGTALGGRVAYSVGYTGLGVGATRFGAAVTLDLLAARDSPLTRLELVRTRPLPFPPEPLAWPLIQATKWSLAAADHREGHRNAWLRLLDRIGLGFDS